MFFLDPCMAHFLILFKCLLMLRKLSLNTRNSNIYLPPYHTVSWYLYIISLNGIYHYMLLYIHVFNFSLEMTVGSHAFVRSNLERSSTPVLQLPVGSNILHRYNTVSQPGNEHWYNPLTVFHFSPVLRALTYVYIQFPVILSHGQAHMTTL